MRKWFFAANWKMNLDQGQAAGFTEEFPGRLQELSGMGRDWQVMLAPQGALLDSVASAVASDGIEVGAQNCGPAASGAFTGEISPALARQLGATWVILGHSERRHVFGEDDALIRRRMDAAWEAGLSVLLCVGETLAEREAGQTLTVVERQLGTLKEGVGGTLAVAYEPVWAIGTGQTATAVQAQEVHESIRKWVSASLPSVDGDALQILYGGSAKPENSEELMGQPDVDGLLVGGASLDPTKFADLIRNGLRCRA